MRAGLQHPHQWDAHLDSDTISGTTVVSTTNNATTVSGTTLYGATVQPATLKFSPGSPYGNGERMSGMYAEAVISGGMWVIGSEGVLKAAPALTQWPLGVAVATTASGAECVVQTRGPRYMIAEGTVGAGLLVQVGSSAKLCTVLANGAGSGNRAVVITGASSGTTSYALVNLL